MSIVRKQWLLLIFIGIIYVVSILSVWAGWRNSIILSDAHQWVDHTEEVLDSIKEARKAVNAADFSGRMELVGMPNGDKQKARDAAFVLLDKAIELVADNPNQTQNLQEVKNAMIERFRIQDLSIQQSVRKNGTFTTPQALAEQSTKSVNRLDVSFMNALTHEYELLAQRHADIVSQETFINNWRAIIPVLALVAVTGLAIVGYKAWTSNYIGARAVDTEILRNEKIKLDSETEEKIKDIIKMMDEGVITE